MAPDAAATGGEQGEPPAAAAKTKAGPGSEAGVTDGVMQCKATGGRCVNPVGLRAGAGTGGPALPRRRGDTPVMS